MCPHKKRAQTAPPFPMGN